MSSEEESPAQRQARLRRERRNAKLQEQGSSRLSKINAMSGRPVAAEAELNKPSPQSLARQRSAGTSPDRRAKVEDAPDPADADISTLSEGSTNDMTFEQQQQQMLRQMLRQPMEGGQGNETNQPGLDGSQSDDPLLSMMQQLMGGPGAPGAQDNTGIPNALEKILRGNTATPQVEPGSRLDYVWRILHAVSSLVLAFYAVIYFDVTSSISRKPGDVREDLNESAPKLLWMFATFELVLQSTRYFIDRGQLPQSGILATVASVIPDPYGNYLRILSRYSTIYTTVVADAMVIVFVLGCVMWWKGLAAA